MSTLRVALWSVALVMALSLGYMSLNYKTATNQRISGPYGGAFQLVDQTGAKVSETVLRSGKPSAVFFGYTHCPDVCPTTLFELDGWLKQADPSGKTLQAFFVTVDPERDTPDLLQQYVSNVSNRIIGWSGAPQNVWDMAKAFRVYFRKVPQNDKDPQSDYTMDHTASVFLLDGKGQFIGTIAYNETADTAVKKLKALMAEKSVASAS